MSFSVSKEFDMDPRGFITCDCDCDSRWWFEYLELDFKVPGCGDTGGDKILDIPWKGVLAKGGNFVSMWSVLLSTSNSIENVYYKVQPNTPPPNEIFFNQMDKPNVAFRIASDNNNDNNNDR